MILLGQLSDPAELPDESVISAITLAELSVGPHVANDDAEYGARQQHLQQAELRTVRWRLTPPTSQEYRDWNCGRLLTRITDRGNAEKR